jgi:hypothetical protein
MFLLITNSVRTNILSLTVMAFDSQSGNGHTQLLSPQRLEEMVMDVYHYPSKHNELTRLITERHDSERQDKRSV